MEFGPKVLVGTGLSGHPLSPLAPLAPVRSLLSLSDERSLMTEFPARGEGWTQVDPVDSAELLSQLQEGEFWVDEEEFLREFDEVTIGYPVTEAGHLQSLYSGNECHS